MSEPISSPSSVPGAEAKPAVTYAFDDPDNPEYISGDKIGIVTGGTLAAALAAGFLYHFGAQFYDSFMYVPLFAGLAAGLLLSLVFRMAKLNAMVPVAVCGIAAGLLTYVVRYAKTDREASSCGPATRRIGDSRRCGARYHPAQRDTDLS